MNLSKLLRKVRFYYLCKKDPVEFSRRMGVRVGPNCRFHGVDLGTFGSEPYLIEVGAHVEITAKVKFLTHDGGVWVFRGKEPKIDVFKGINIGNNVFLGRGAILLPGVTISDNVVVGAGSVVSGFLECDSVYAGVPARRIRSLDSYRKKVEPFVYLTKGMGQNEKRCLLEKRLYGEQK